MPGSRRRFRSGLILQAAGFLTVAFLLVDCVRLVRHPLTVPSFGSIVSGVPSIQTIRSPEERFDALDPYERILARIEAEPAVIIPDESLSLLLTQYTFLLDGEDLSKMNRLIDRALELDGANAVAWKLRGIMAMKAGRPDDARVSLRRYLQINPNAPDRDEVLLMIGI